MESIRQIHVDTFISLECKGQCLKSLTPKIHQHLISLYNTSYESNMKVTRIEEIITY